VLLKKSVIVANSDAIGDPDSTLKAVHLMPKRDFAVTSQQPPNHANTLATLRFSERTAHDRPLVSSRVRPGLVPQTRYVIVLRPISRASSFETPSGNSAVARAPVTRSPP
jgi:hypothetical protein